MRSILVLVASAMVASCAAQPIAPVRTAKAQERLDQLIAGKVAGAPLSCLASYNATDMVVIDDDTIAFRRGRSQTFVNHLQGGCSQLGNGNALVTRSSSGLGLCRGEIAEVAHLGSGITVGTCVLGDFIPYSRPRG